MLSPTCERPIVIRTFPFKTQSVKFSHTGFGNESDVVVIPIDSQGNGRLGYADIGANSLFYGV